MATKNKGTAVKGMTGTMHATSVGMDEKLRESMVAVCNQQLANTADLVMQTKQAHWNVKGIHFEPLHGLFDKMAETIFPFIDEIAERATALGGTALGTTRMAAGATQLPDFPADAFEGTTVLKIVVERWARYVEAVRSAVTEADDEGDLVTADMFIAISHAAEKMLWFAEAHLQA
jgi:starvation-inducible DNA-binding protein